MASDTDTAAGNLDTIESRPLTIKPSWLRHIKLEDHLCIILVPGGKLSILSLLAQAAICIMSVIFLVSHFLPKTPPFPNPVPAAFTIYMSVV